jgi:hypothetical protein
MSGKPWPLLRLKAESDEELKELYRAIYVREYVEQEIYDYNGRRVIFPYGQFDHAFSESSDYRRSMGDHDIPFSKKRARYILWIKKVLSKAPGVVSYHFELRSEMRRKKGRQTVVRQYVVVEERYIVVLDQKGDKLYFITAVPHDASSFKRFRERSSELGREKIPSTLGG